MVDGSFLGRGLHYHRKPYHTWLGNPIVYEYSCRLHRIVRDPKCVRSHPHSNDISLVESPQQKLESPEMWLNLGVVHPWFFLSFVFVKWNTIWTSNFAYQHNIRTKMCKTTFGYSVSLSFWSTIKFRLFDMLEMGRILKLCTIPGLTRRPSSVHCLNIFS